MGLNFKVLRDKYIVYEDGSISRIKRGGFKSFELSNSGYYRVKLSLGNGYKHYSVSRIVYETFFGEIPEGMVVDHIDGNRLNNHKDNLQVLTNKENILKGFVKNHRLISPDGQEVSFSNISTFCKQFNLHSGHISEVLKGKRASHKNYKKGD